MSVEVTSPVVGWTSRTPGGEPAEDRRLQGAVRRWSRPSPAGSGRVERFGRSVARLSARVACGTLVLLVQVWADIVHGAPADTGAPPVVIDFFFETGCPECQRVKEEILPQLESRCEGFYVLVLNDLGNTTNMVKFMAYQAALGTTNRSESVSMVVDYKRSFNGLDEIRKGLIPEVEHCVEARLQPGWTPPVPIVVGASPGRVAGGRGDGIGDAIRPPNTGATSR